MYWTTILNWFQSNPVDWVAIFISIGVGVFSIYQFYDGRSKSTKIESARFIMELNERFLEEPFKLISRRIGMTIEKEIPFEIKDENDKRNIFNYLSELETVSSFFLEGILIEKQTYELLGNQILESLQVKEIKNIIIDERKKEGQEDLFDNLEIAWIKMKKYHRKKLNKQKTKLTNRSFP